ncbi:dihydrofolate reductase family protein [Pseudoduganella violaceinigra]|uniref:dihydrofolate reductase family protein n=1 Tax=Pseudoduganella violaceinigra TaxID=246602 RepID=UPI00040B035E|nr:dihydrofolate reductase family protein [Pseudoduganella violaceinigra]
MSRLRVACFAISVDGFGAGPNQGLEHPLGVGGEKLHNWMFPTQAFQAMHGSGQGTTGMDNDYAQRGMENIGAWILGRNMFAPSRGAWPDDNWRGWWGPNPPYHTPVFVLTHHAREPLVMEGGTTFHFVTGGIREALDLARAAANGKDVRLGGGTETVRQYLEAGLVDEMHLVQSPILLGSGEHLFAGLNLKELGYSVSGHESSPAATHLSIRKD